MQTIIIALTWIICCITASPCSGNDSAVNLSPEEKAWLDSRHEVRVRIGHSPPFMLTDGEIRGMAIDYLTHIFKANNIRFTYIQESEVSWPQALDYIRRHEAVDMVPTAKITEDRKKDMIFTEEYIAAPWVIFTRMDSAFISSIDDLNGKTVSVEEGYVMHHRLKQDYPGIHLRVVPAAMKDFAEIPVRDLSTGLVDAYIGNLLSTTYTIQTKGYANVKVAAPTPFDNHNQAMAIRSDWPELAGIINKTLSSMRPDEHAAIRNRWLSIRYEYGVRRTDVLKWIAGIAGIALLLIGFVLFWNRRLQSEVAFRKNIESALRESEQHISSIFRSAPVGIGLVVNRVLKSVNSRLCEISGYEEQELIGQNARMLYPTDDDFEFVGREKYAQIRAHGTGTVETRWLKKNGAVIDVLLSSTPLDLKDWSRGVTFTALDITERKRAEQNIDMAHGKLLTILDSIDTTIYVADMETHEILFMNKKMIMDFGGEVIKGKCFKAFRQKTEPCDFCTNRQLIDADGRPAGVVTWQDQNPVTGKFYINRDRAVEWIDGRLVRLQIATDVTEFKKIERQLIQAQKMESVGRLAGGVAHDFNNMLGVILGHTELALEKLDENHSLYTDMKEIRTAALRSADLTKQLLTFARKQIIDPRRIDLNSTVEGMLKMLRRLIGEDIDLAWEPAKGLWPVKMDTSQVDQILANLCVNARDAITGVGKLTIETGMVSFDEAYCAEHPGFLPGDFVLLAVSDDGCGMDKQTLDNLFEPFFTTKDIGKGTGLGLATVYGVVKQNKGFINVYSEPGQGSTFKIYLPRHTGHTDCSETPPPEAGEKESPAGNETILLVEDEPAILQITRTILERKGYTVLSTAVPAKAMELAKTHDGGIDLLMTDVVMPGMNGRDLAKHLTALYPGIRSLFMSGYTANVIAHHGVLDEGVAFIQKPFSMTDLAEKVRAVLDGA